MSVPFTWLLDKAQMTICELPGDWLVGGPAVALMPHYLKRCEIAAEYPGVLQRINPQATRTTLGCPNKCAFCGVKAIEPTWRELDDWPDLPVLCDNNLLAASREHFERVCLRLRAHGWCDFNQGLDCRLMTPWHAGLIRSIGRPVCRLALDHDSSRDTWAAALGYLEAAGVPKSLIRSYVMCGFSGSPEDDWRRCNFVEDHGVKALPMWFHELTAMDQNNVTREQWGRGWTQSLRKNIMRWHYKHCGVPLVPR